MITLDMPPPGAGSDWTIPQDWDRYTAEEHAVWDTLFARQAAMLKERACQAFLRGMDVLHLSRPGIPDFRELSQKLAAADQARLRRAADTAHVPVGTLDRMQPWLAALTLTVAPLMQAGMDPSQGVDKQLKARMTQAGKPVDGLENAEQQLKIFATMPEAMQLDMLRQTFREVDEGPKKLRELVDAWKNGDTTVIARLESVELKKDSPALYKSLIVDRNKAWAQILAKRLRAPASGTSIVAVGAGHLAGPDSLQKQLQSLGFTVTVE